MVSCLLLRSGSRPPRAPSLGSGNAGPLLTGAGTFLTLASVSHPPASRQERLRDSSMINRSPRRIRGWGAAASRRSAERRRAERPLWEGSCAGYMSAVLVATSAGVTPREDPYPPSLPSGRALDPLPSPAASPLPPRGPPPRAPPCGWQPRAAPGRISAARARPPRAVAPWGRPRLRHRRRHDPARLALRTSARRRKGPIGRGRCVGGGVV